MISFWISVVPPKIETISLNPGRANDSSAHCFTGAVSAPSRSPPPGRCSDRPVTSVTSNLVYGPGHRPREITKAVGDRGGIGTIGRPRPGMLPTWPDTNKGGSLYDPVVQGTTDGGTPGSGGSDLDRAADETSCR